MSSYKKPEQTCAIPEILDFQFLQVKILLFDIILTYYESMDTTYV